MKMYMITEDQLNSAIDAAYAAANEAHSWGDDFAESEYEALARDLKAQGIMTEHFSFDEKLMGKLVFELFKMGKYLDLLESTFSKYCEEEAKEMLSNVWQCRDMMEVLLRTK